MSRQQIAFLIALFLILVVALLVPRCHPATPPISEPVPWPTSTPPATQPPRPTPATPIVIGTRILTPPPTILPAATPTYLIAQVGDKLFQRMLAQQASDVTFRYTTVTRFVGPSVALSPAGAGGELRTEGVYAYGNRYHLVTSGGELVVEATLIGNMLYTRQADTPDAWRIEELSAQDATLLRLDVPAAILSADVLVKRLGSERLEGIAVPVTKYEVTIPPERVRQYILQLAASSGSGSPAYPAGTDAGQLLAVTEPAYVWVGDDGHQYRLDFVLTIQAANADVKPAISTSTTFRDFNDPSVRIAVPEGPFVRQ